MISFGSSFFRDDLVSAKDIEVKGRRVMKKNKVEKINKPLRVFNLLADLKPVKRKIYLIHPEPLILLRKLLFLVKK